jgi:IstB-like ATP binding protein
VTRTGSDDLAGLGFVEAGTPVLLRADRGVARAILAIALATRTDMVAAMTTAYADGSFAIKLRTYAGPSVLVIDDVAITPFDRAQDNAFFQVVNRRYEKRSATISRPTEACRRGPNCAAATTP